MDVPQPPASSTGAQQPLIALVEGTWSPAAQIAYGLACAPFEPTTNTHDPDSSTRTELNPHQVRLPLVTRRGHEGPA